MKISKLIEILEHHKANMGDVEVTMQGSALADGFSQHGLKAMPDVFETSIESAIAYDEGEKGINFKRLRLFWQC